jgi:hypothetical protein
VVSTTSAPTVSTTPLPTVTALERGGVQLEQPIVIVNNDGVVQINSDGTITPLVTGPVAYAVDDTRGGLLFQIERGRQVFAGYQGEPPPGDPTIIWWIPKGASAPQALLVPTPGEGQYLSLHDAYATGDSFAVVYERHEGTVPFDTDDGAPADMADTLRVYDAATGIVAEVYRTRGYEWSLAHVNGGGGLLSATEVQILGEGCRLLDGATGESVTRPGFPAATPTCFDETTDCASSCALSSDATLVAYDYWRQVNGLEWDILVAETATGTEVARFSVPVAGRWGPAEIDVHDDQLLLNRAWEGIYDSPALLVDLTDPHKERIELPVAGRARFVTQVVEIAAPVSSPDSSVFLTEGPVIYWYGETGLTRIANGEETQLEPKPVMWAVDHLMGGVIYRLDWRLDAETTYWLKADGSLETMVYEPGFVAVIDGAPTAAMVVESVSGDVDIDLLLVDLRSGRERRLTNVGFAGDGWSFPRSFGGGIFVGVDGAAVGCGGSDAVFAFWDEDGRRIDHPHNPVREPCGPCELSAVIAPDGRLLAYSQRADAPSEYHGRLVCGGHDDWWEATQDILGEVVIIDLETGEAVFQADAPPQARVADFDGRYVVVASGAWDRRPIATIHDTWGEDPPVTVSGSAILVHPPLSETTALLRADGLGATRFGEEAETAEEILVDHFGPPSSVWEFAATGREDPGCHLATGYGCDKYFRSLSWEQIGLAVVLIDASPYRDDAFPHFAGWSLWEAPARDRLTTPEGVAIGTTIADLQAAYGDELELSPWLDACAIEDTWEFTARGIRGSLSGPPRSPTTSVTTLESGVQSSC